MTDISKTMADFAAAHIVPKTMLLRDYLANGQLDMAARDLNSWGAGAVFFHYNKDESAIDIYDFRTGVKQGSVVYEEDHFKHVALYPEGLSTLTHYTRDIVSDDPTVIAALADGLMNIRAPSDHFDRMHSFQGPGLMWRV